MQSPIFITITLSGTVPTTVLFYIYKYLVLVVVCLVIKLMISLRSEYESFLVIKNVQVDNLATIKKNTYINNFNLCTFTNIVLIYLFVCFVFFFSIKYSLINMKDTDGEEG